MRSLRYIFFAALWLSVLCAAAQRPPVFTRVEAGRKIMEVDSALLLADSLQRDSILQARHLQDSLIKDSVAYAKFKVDSIRRNRHFSLTKDTIGPWPQFALSLVPGMGQIYNKQWWKAPVFGVAMAGFITGGVIFGNQYTVSQRQWQAAVNAKLPEDITRPLQQKMFDDQSASTIFYCLAGATYLYSLADATMNYRGRVNHVRKATMLAALFPGAGFFYTRTYWRIPIYYGAFAVLGSVVDYNNRYYVRFQRAYDIVASGDPTQIDEFNGRYSLDALKNARDAYRRDRDFGIIALSVVYLLSVIDTYVIAMLKNWDVSPDLSVRVAPALFNEKLGYANSLPSGAGVSLRLNF